MKNKLTLIFLLMTTASFAQKTIHDFKFNAIDGTETTFKKFAGKKILIVNTASECGFTRQYEGLQKLHEAHGEQLIIIGFPANNFGGQEPGENQEIAGFCKKNYGVTFLMAEKVSVSGNTIHPIFKWLCAQQNDSFQGKIDWNFEKFLLDENGKLIARFRSGVEPISEEIVSLLGKG